MTKKLFCVQRPDRTFVYGSIDSYKDHVYLWDILEKELGIKRKSYALGEQEEIVAKAGYKIVRVKFIETSSSKIYCVKSPKTGIVPWAHCDDFITCWYQWGFDVAEKEIGSAWAQEFYHMQQSGIKFDLEQRGYSVVPVEIIKN